VGDDASILRHLRSGQDQRVRISEAIAAFGRLAPEDYGYFLATIEAALGGRALPELAAASPLLLAGAPAPNEDSARAAADAKGGGLREAVLGLLADGRPRSTIEIRTDLEATRSVNRASLNTEIFTMRKMGLIRSEGQGRGRRHTRVGRVAAAARPAASGKSREPKSRAAKRKRDDDEDHPAEQSRLQQPNAEQLYATAISGHELLTAAEELALSKRLEQIEIGLWAQLLAGPLADEAQQQFLALETPADPKNAKQARVADLDRVIITSVCAIRKDKADPLANERRALRDAGAEAVRIRERFVACNLRLVPSIIRRYGYHLTTTLTMSDLIQEGNCGLLRAIPRFDYRRKLRFSTFATWWIRHYLVRARQNMGTEVRVPVHLYDLASKVRQAKLRLRAELGRDPTQDEIAGAIKVSKKSLQTLDSAWLRYREAVPMFDSTGEEGETPSYLASDGPLADEILSQHQDDGRIAEAVTRMPPLLAKIIRRRFGFDGLEAETLKEIGVSMNLSRERIRQLEQKALRLLRGVLSESTVVADRTARGHQTNFSAEETVVEDRPREAVLKLVR